MKKLLDTAFHKILKVDDTPRRIALAYSIGVFLAFSPLLGFHFLLGVGIAFRYGLSRLAVLAGVFSNTPWTLVPYYSFATWLGSVFFSGQSFVDPALLETRLEDVLTLRFWESLLDSWELLIPFATGSTLLAVLLAAVAYPISLACIQSFRRRGSPSAGQA